VIAVVRAAILRNMSGTSRLRASGRSPTGVRVTDQPADDLLAIAADVAADLDEIEEAATSKDTTYARVGMVYARVRPDQLEVRLPGDIIEAALRTSDTSRADAGWLRFRPTSNERHVADRARAWLVTAWRHAGEDA